ncbi:hypothetical protein FRB94_012968 [Tulasnella sp. JGI-2019a]|nr:hypothetical protein FRB94_012968 [Tulasnella sp. JGI-2019a]KAG9023831.1 hypothetical protein FRB95_012413 [Tulasnella sp. JGI-2019a]
MCNWVFSVFLPPSQDNMANIAVACAETVLTVMIGHPAAVALDKVLSQKAPERGLPGGQLESFLRIMRENHLRISISVGMLNKTPFDSESA